jgi:hypothetical protein
MTKPLNDKQKRKHIEEILGPLTLTWEERKGYSARADRRAEIKRGEMLSATSPGYVATKGEYIRRLWENLTEIGEDEYAVVDAMGPRRRPVRWNGQQWVVINEAAWPGRKTA